ncbi:nucleolar DEAD-box protein required for synthesis of 60S ribosomal subunit [Venturia effusa]|uniref:RNA helicase n=1 Tax=Venturia effusa TaxID=50376 RepID=A0A517LPL7_9PEZI|nr:nucleolar DEAD-box protein required for synthesis of 60S ribosomal subunit [Venturia effusa]
MEKTIQIQPTTIMAPMLDDDFVLTISDNEDIVQVPEDDLDLPAPTQDTRKRKRDAAEAALESKKKSKKSQGTGVNSIRVQEAEIPEEDEPNWADGGEDDGAMDSDFEFQVGESTGVIEDFDGWERSVGEKRQTGSSKGVDIDDIISRRLASKSKTNGHTKPAETDQSDSDEETSEPELEDEDDEDILATDGFGMGELSDEDVGDDDGEEEEDNGDHSDAEGSEEDDSNSESDADSVATAVEHPDDIASASDHEEDEEDPAEAERRAAFFAPETNLDVHKPTATKQNGSFQTFGLSRPILKGLTTVGFSDPTPIQAKTIPVALLGKDVVGGAVTGSGKTAAFIIPILERLLYRPKKVPTTRVAILMPTRELAVQCFNVAKKLASFTDITFAQVVGGFSLREQENVLRQRPDVIIATPGRFIDHMRNSASFTVENLEILVLDEADRMLEDGFKDELNEILTTIPKSRQTMLFSATMTDTVDELIRVGLNRPVRLMVDAKKQTVTGLVQEFVRLRAGREKMRLACLLYLCKNVYPERVIVFFRQKKDAHRIRVVFALCGLKAAELHGSMSQEQRISSVESFRDGHVNFLLATDLASRGLDIKNVNTVINYEAPQSHEIYLHRVGRTARAGRTGRSCTIAAEPDRKVVKAAVKSARAQGAKVVSRVLPVAEIDEWAEKLESMADEIKEVLNEERDEKLMTTAERDMKRGENLIVHESEIMSRPKRTWFESEKEKVEASKRGLDQLNNKLKGKDIPKGKLSNKIKKKLDTRDERSEGRMWKKGKADTAKAGQNLKDAKKSKSKPVVGKDYKI